MKITGWTDWEDKRYSEDIPDDIFEEVQNAVAVGLRYNGYKFDGYYHQFGSSGVPIIDDKWAYKVSQRSWGHMMVRAYPDEIDDRDGMGYCEWAWRTPWNEAVTPKGEGKC